MTAPTTPSPERQPADAGGGLLPCPMCDGPGHLQHTVQQLDDGWNVICHGKKDCPLFCSTPYRLHDTKAEARAAWNRRNPVPQAQPDWNYEGAMSDLDSAISVLIKRINGEADLASAAEWVRLNYPKRAGEIKAQPNARSIFSEDVGTRFLQERLVELAAMFNVPDGGRYLNDWKARADQINQALSAPAADDGWRPTREEVARIIDPQAWGAFADEQIAYVEKHNLVHSEKWFGTQHMVRRSETLKQADAILALHPAAPTDEVGKS